MGSSPPRVTVSGRLGAALPPISSFKKDFSWLPIVSLPYNTVDRYRGPDTTPCPV